MKKALFLFAITLMTCNLFASDTATFSIQVGGLSKFAPITVKDQVTGNLLAATVANISIVNNNPEIATISSTTSNQIKATAVAAGNGTAIVTCQVTYTDQGDGLQKTENKSIVVKYTVTGSPHGVKLALTFN